MNGRRPKDAEHILTTARSAHIDVGQRVAGRVLGKELSATHRERGHRGGVKQKEAPILAADADHACSAARKDHGAARYVDIRVARVIAVGGQRLEEALERSRPRIERNNAASVRRVW